MGQMLEVVGKEAGSHPIVCKGLRTIYIRAMLEHGKM